MFVGTVGTVAATANRFLGVGMSGDQAWARGLKTAMSSLSGETFEAASNFNLLVIPMFILMGNVAGASGMSKDLFTAAYRWIGHFRGGLASATITACAGFAALSGSSLASAVTMGACGPARDEAVQVCVRAFDGVRCGERHPRLPDTAVRRHDHLRRPDGSIHRPSVHGRRCPRNHPDPALHRHHLARCSVQTRCRAGRRTVQRERPPPIPDCRNSDPDRRRDHDRRHVYRVLHAGRGVRRRCFPHARGRRGAPIPEMVDGGTDHPSDHEIDGHRVPDHYRCLHLHSVHVADRFGREHG